MLDPALQIREYDSTDRDFIYSSWLSSFKGSHYAGPVPDNVYWKLYQFVLEKIIPDSTVKIVCSHEYPSQIVGWICYRDSVVHYLYVKQPFRGKGIAKELLTKTVGQEFSYTFKTAKSRYFSNSFKARFNPNLVRKKRRGKTESPEDTPEDPMQVPQ